MKTSKVNTKKEKFADCHINLKINAHNEYEVNFHKSRWLIYVCIMS